MSATTLALVGTRRLRAGLVLVALILVVIVAMYLVFAFQDLYRIHLLEIVNNDVWTEKQKIAALLKAGSWVPCWRLSLLLGALATLLVACFWCLGFEPRGPANWLFLLLLFFFALSGAQNIRVSHTEAEGTYRALRLLYPDSPHDSCWSEFKSETLQRT